MDAERELVLGCLAKNRASERKFYYLHRSKMFGVCLRFAGNKMEAQDILQEGYIRVFANLQYFRFEGSLEGWVRKIILNTAVTFCKQNAKYQNDVELVEAITEATFSEDALSLLSEQDLLAVINELPMGCRTVFNLKVIDGYEHKEIAIMLGISEGTSKSQLFKAKDKIRRLMDKK